MNEIRFPHGEWVNRPSGASAAAPQHHTPFRTDPWASAQHGGPPPGPWLSGRSTGVRRRTPVALWVTAIAVLVLVAGTVGVVILTKQDNSPRAVMDTIAADIADWRGIRMRFTATSDAGFDITIDRDGNSTGTMVVAGVAGTQGGLSIPGSRIDLAKIDNRSMTRTDGGPWMRSPATGRAPDSEASGGPEWLADRLHGTVWIEEPGRMLDGQRVRTFSAPEHPEYGLFLVSTGLEPRLVGMTSPQLQASDEPPTRIEQADPETLAEIKALEPVAASLPN